MVALISCILLIQMKSISPLSCSAFIVCISAFCSSVSSGIILVLCILAGEGSPHEKFAEVIGNVVRAITAPNPSIPTPNTVCLVFMGNKHKEVKFAPVAIRLYTMTLIQL